MKRYNNKLIVIVLAIVAVFATIALGCANSSKKPQPPQITAFAAPTVSVAGDTLTWTAADGATNGYTVKINSDETTVVMSTSLDLVTVMEMLVAGDNTLAVKVNGVEGVKSESAYSKAVAYNFVPPVVMITGATDTEIMRGTYFDCYAGITATTQDGDDLTSLITVSGILNTAVAGKYTLTYSVTYRGATVNRPREITVIENPEIGKEVPIPSYTVSGGRDYNIAKGCVSASTGVQGNATADKATDGDYSTRWESPHGVDNINYTVDLGMPLDITSVTIYWEEAYATDFTLRVSDDGSDWKDIRTVTGQKLSVTDTAGSKTYINSFATDGVKARYVRIACTKRNTAYGYSIFELEVLGPKGTVLPTEEYPDLFNARKDGEPDWTIADEQWFEIDLGAEKSVDGIHLAFKNYLMPAEYKVLYAGANKQFKEVKIKNRPYSGDTFDLTVDGVDNSTVGARYFRVEMSARRFYVPSYRLTEVDCRSGETTVKAVSATASSALLGQGALLAIDGDADTYWENDNDNKYQTVDLGEVKAVGRIDMYWRGDDGGKGKYYDLQTSTDGVTFTTVFRQTHGATQLQRVFLYSDARYIRVIDYQSQGSDRFDLEGMVVHSQYPASSGEGRVEYDVTLEFPKKQVIETNNGSYVTGITDFPSSRLIAYLDDSLRGKPVPSNDWWQGLLIADKGYNMYMNPLTATFMSDGLWLTNPGSGYFDGFVPGNGSQTVAVDEHDLAIGYAGMRSNAEVRVTGYSDYGVSAVMTDNRGLDKLTVFLSEGTLYAYCLFAEPEKAMILAKNYVGIYDLKGNKILTDVGQSHVGDGIVVCVRTLSTYETGVRKYKDGQGKEQQNAPIYEERYYVVNVPQSTRFTMGEDVISVVMTEGNYMSVGAVAQKNEVKNEAPSGAAFPLAEVGLLHDHGYAFVVGTSCLYDFDEKTNTVTTEFRLRTMLMRNGYSPDAYSAYLPHQTAKSDYKGGYAYSSIRGDCYSHEGNLFVTKDVFYGVVPTFVEPTDDGYSSKVMYDQLIMLYNNNGGDKAPEDSDLISADPYWQGKNLHPMAMAAIAADQLGATDLRDKFLDKIQYILTDWFTYDEKKDAGTGAYFYYDPEWGTLYYKNSEFGAGVNLADHYFTYGYYTLAAGVLCAYRPQFAVDFGDMVELLIRDYMNPSRDDELFPYMRNFDPFAGHGWAGGYADNNGGNNQESAGEALNSWVGAYLYATAIGDEKVRRAAIYGYTTELNAIKRYWFNYEGNFPTSYPYGVVGQVYGGSNFFGTFFNGQPLYMYGIHLIPGEEYLTSYGINAAEREALERMLDTMREEQRGWDVEEKDKEINAWQHIFIPIVAIYDPDEAIEWYDEVLKKQGNVGNTSEQFNVYWLIHGMKSTGLRSTDIFAENGASATVYKKGDDYNALCWNPTGKPITVTFRTKDGVVVGSAVVPANSLVCCDPTENTTDFDSYTDISDFELDGVWKSQNVTATKDKLTFGQNGSASYLLTFGSEESYYGITVEASGSVKLILDGKEIKQGDPISLSFKHTLTIEGSAAEVRGVKLDKLTLTKDNVGLASAVASSEKDGNTAVKAMDGNMTSRWETVHGHDGEWLTIELNESTLIYQLRIYWEGASAAEYKISLSESGGDDDWTEVYYGVSSQGARTDYVNPSVIMRAKFIRIDCIARTTNYGYSIYEMEVYNFNNNQGV